MCERDDLIFVDGQFALVESGPDFRIGIGAVFLSALHNSTMQFFSGVAASGNEKLLPIVGFTDHFPDRDFCRFHRDRDFRGHSVLFDRKFQFVVKWRIPALRLLYGDHIVLFGHLVLFGAFVDEFRPKMSPHIAVRRTLVFVQDTADCCVVVLAESR